MVDRGQIETKTHTTQIYDVIIIVYNDIEYLVHMMQSERS